MKYNVDVGKDWEIYDVPKSYQVQKGKAFGIHSVKEAEPIRELARTALSVGVTAVSVPMVLGAAMVGLADGSFNELSAVTNGVSLVVGIVIGHYFLGNGR